MGDVKAVVPDRERIRLLLKSAVLAPSSHNTQPWRFGITNNLISLYADRRRRLPVNDPDDRELTISCGCALMNLCVAAANEGFKASCRTVASDTDDRLAIVDLEPSIVAVPPESRLFHSIGGRRTYRKSFQSREISDEVVQMLIDTAVQEGAWLQVIGLEEDRQAVARLVAEGDSLQWSNPEWRRELANWMRPSRQRDGLSVPVLVRPLARIIVRNFDMGSSVGVRDRQLAERSPLLVVLGTPGDEVADWLVAGQALQRILLAAHDHGLQASFLNQPIQLPSLRSRLQRRLRRDGWPQILLRLGYPVGELAATPRRSLDHVID